MSSLPPPYSPPTGPPVAPPVAPYQQPPYQPTPGQQPPYQADPYAGRGPAPRPPAPSTGSKAITVVAAVMGILIVAGVAWITLRDSDESTTTNSKAPVTLTPTVPAKGPIAGQTEAIGDGWLTYRTPDGTWLVDLPSIPASPKALPSNPTVQILYGKTDWGRVGFGWSKGQLSPETDETAILVELMKGIALSRGAADITPEVISGPAGVAVTASMDLTGGKALFVLRSIDRRPVVAMVVAGLGEPDPAVAARMIDSFRPGT